MMTMRTASEVLEKSERGVRDLLNNLGFRAPGQGVKREITLREYCTAFMAQQLVRSGLNIEAAVRISIYAADEFYLVSLYERQTWLIALAPYEQPDNWRVNTFYSDEAAADIVKNSKGHHLIVVDVRDSLRKALEAVQTAQLKADIALHDAKAEGHA